MVVCLQNMGAIRFQLGEYSSAHACFKESASSLDEEISKLKNEKKKKEEDGKTLLIEIKELDMKM